MTARRTLQEREATQAAPAAESQVIRGKGKVGSEDEIRKLQEENAALRNELAAARKTESKNFARLHEQDARIEEFQTNIREMNAEMDRLRQAAAPAQPVPAVQKGRAVSQEDFDRLTAKNKELNEKLAKAHDERNILFHQLCENLQGELQSQLKRGQFRIATQKEDVKDEIHTLKIEMRQEGDKNFFLLLHRGVQQAEIWNPDDLNFQGFVEEAKGYKEVIWQRIRSKQ